MIEKLYILIPCLKNIFEVNSISMTLSNHRKEYFILKKDKFFEYGFRTLTLLFWPIIIYKWIFISNYYLERNLFMGYSFLAILYILNIGILQIKNSFFENIIIYYRVGTLISFILTLASFLLFPTNITLLLLKVLSISIYFYISCKNVFTYHIDECVVGIISSILLLSISICY